MYTLIALLLFSLTFSTTADNGCGIDPNGCHATALAGSAMDPNGGATTNRGPLIDPDGLKSRGTLDPDGRGFSIDPNG